MNEIARGGVSESQISLPTGGPNQVIRSVGGAGDRRVAHELVLPQRRLEPSARNAVPVASVAAYQVAQAGIGGFVKGGKYIIFFIGAARYEKQQT
ncbi:hypothetical protein AXF24_12195 [Streptococcus pneumoniae]|nr:hypothetical protein AWW74_12895 [Streptococcus pneumoniae]KWX82311.1 hypothetical protein AWW74_12225 [Streptococcus pneumoniae]KXB94435.1 hypothetical protein AXF24_12880 [Streptococcus pneumoniae]KXB94848.1 hypothetical protein AXF24_12195 [Streptococcus pneumoniae]